MRSAGVRQRATWDVMDRATRLESIGPARTYAAVNPGFAPTPTPEERLEVITAYDPEGQPRSVARYATPDYGGGALLTVYSAPSVLTR